MFILFLLVREKNSKPAKPQKMDFILIDIFRNNAQFLAYFHKHPYL